MRLPLYLRLADTKARGSLSCFSSQSVGDTTALSDPPHKNNHRRTTTIPESWENLTNRLLNRAFYPVGFSHRRPPAEVASWLHQVEEALRQTTPFLEAVSRSFRLLDRVQEEQVPLLPQAIVAADRMQWVLTCWKTAVLQQQQQHSNNMDPENLSADLSPEQVWQRISRYTADGTVERNAMYLSLVFHVIGQLETPRAAPAQAEALLERHLEEYYRTSSSDDDLQHRPDHPDVSTINHLLKLWLDSGLTEQAPGAADRWVQRLRHWAKSSSSVTPQQQQQQLPQMQPNSITYTTLIATYKAYADPAVAARRAEELLREMEEDTTVTTATGQQQQRRHPPDFVLYSSVIDAVAHAGNVERAQTLLRELMEKRAAAVADGGKGVVLEESSSSSFSGAYSVASILEAYRNRIGLKQQKAAVVVQQMEAFLNEMENLAGSNDKLAIFRPNEVCYAILIGAYVRLGDPQRAESILEHVLKLQKSRSPKMPLTSVWNGVLEVWTKSGHPEAVQRATNLVKLMEDMSKEDSSCQPNVNTYNILLNCHANSSTPIRGSFNSKLLNARKAQEIFDRMQGGEIAVRPNEVSCDTVLSVWCKANCPGDAERLLVRMCEEAVAATGRNNPQQQTSSVRKEQPPSVVRPTSRHFTTVMNGWAGIAKTHPGNEQPLQRIENLLKAMQDLHSSKGLDTKPTLIAYNIFLNCLSHSRDPRAPDRVESILRFILDTSDLRPDATTYNSVLTAWSRSKRPEALPRAQQLFDEMKLMDSETNRVISAHSYTILMSFYSQRNKPEKVQQLFDEMMQSGNLRPNFYTYTALLHAWANAGNPHEAARVLQQILRDYEEGNFGSDAIVSTAIFNGVLNAWLRSHRPDAAEKAEDGLRSMYSLAASRRFGLQGPDLISFSTVIKAYSFSDHPERARRAMDLFEHVRSLYNRTGNPAIQPDLRLFADLIHVLLEACPTAIAENQTVDTVQKLLDDMARDSPYWKKQGVYVISGIGYRLSQSKLGTHHKALLIHRLQSLANQYSVKIDGRLLLSSRSIPIKKQTRDDVLHI